MLKVTEEELNAAYTELKEAIKSNRVISDGDVEIKIHRNALVDDLFEINGNLSTSATLTFGFDKELGKNGSWKLLTDIELIEE